MQITISMDLTAENLDKLKLLLNDTAEIKCDVKAEVKEENIETPIKPVAVTERVKETPQVTITMIREKAMILSHAKKQNKIAEVFAKYGTKNVSGLKPEDYAAVYVDLLAEISGGDASA